MLVARGLVFQWTTILGPGAAPERMLSYCTWAQDAAGTKAQKEIWLISGLRDHWFLSVTTEA